MKGKYTVILERNEDGGFTVYAPALPGCISQGDTAEEALVNIKEAIEGYLEAVEELGKPLPVEIEVEIPA